MLNQLRGFNELMQDAINNKNIEKYEKTERDFNDLVGRCRKTNEVIRCSEKLLSTRVKKMF